MEARNCTELQAHLSLFFFLYFVFLFAFIVCILPVCHNGGGRREDLLRDLKRITHMTNSLQDTVPVDSKYLELGGRGEIMDDNIYN